MDTQKERFCFQGLDHVIVETGKSKSAGRLAGWRPRSWPLRLQTEGRLDTELPVPLGASVSSPEAPTEAHLCYGG